MIIKELTTGTNEDETFFQIWQDHDGMPICVDIAPELIPSLIEELQLFLGV